MAKVNTTDDSICYGGGDPTPPQSPRDAFVTILNNV